MFTMIFGAITSIYRVKGLQYLLACFLRVSRHVLIQLTSPTPLSLRVVFYLAALARAVRDLRSSRLNREAYPQEPRRPPTARASSATPVDYQAYVREITTYIVEN